MQATSSEQAVEHRQASWAITRVVGGTIVAFVALFLVAALVHPPLMEAMMSMASSMMH